MPQSSLFFQPSHSSIKPDFRPSSQPTDLELPSNRTCRQLLQIPISFLFSFITLKPPCCRSLLPSCHSACYSYEILCCCASCLFVFEVSLALHITTLRNTSTMRMLFQAIIVDSFIVGYCNFGSKHTRTSGTNQMFAWRVKV